MADAASAGPAFPALLENIINPEEPAAEAPAPQPISPLRERERVILKFPTPPAPFSFAADATAVAVVSTTLLSATPVPLNAPPAVAMFPGSAIEPPETTRDVFADIPDQVHAKPSAPSQSTALGLTPVWREAFDPVPASQALPLKNPAAGFVAPDQSVAAAVRLAWTGSPSLQVAAPEFAAAPKPATRKQREDAPVPPVSDPMVSPAAPLPLIGAVVPPPAPGDTAPATSSRESRAADATQPGALVSEAPAEMPPALKRMLDQGSVQFAEPSTEYLKRIYDRTELSFEKRFVAVTAASREPVPAVAAWPANAAFKLPAHEPAVHASAPSVRSAVSDTPMRQTIKLDPAQPPANHSEQPAPDEPNPPIRRGQPEDKSAAAAATVESAPPANRALDMQPAPSAPPPEVREAPEPAARPEIARQVPPDFEPVHQSQDVPAPRTAAARDIRLELASGERRVEVRLSERAGELHVAVRTPDERLSGALRDNLPTLSSRLEQAGFRSESAAAALAGAQRSVVEHSSATANTSFDNGRESNQGQSQGQPEGQERRQPQSQFRPEEQPNRKQKGQEFAWLVSSLT